MQDVSELYRQITSGDYYCNLRIKMYRSFNESRNYSLTGRISSTSDVGIIVNENKWEQTEFGGRNGTTVLTYYNGSFWCDYGLPSARKIRLSDYGISFKVINPNVGVNFIHKGDQILITRLQKSESLLYIFTEDEIVSIKPEQNLFSEDTPAIGCCYSNQVDISLAGDPVIVPKMAKFVIEVCVCNDNYQSEWVPNGVYFIDQRTPEYDNDGNVLTWTYKCYDSMLKTEQTYREFTSIREWPASQETVAKEICSLINVSFEANFFPTSAYKVDYPNEKTMRDILSEIAVSNCGNFVITKNDSLRFIKFKGNFEGSYPDLNSKWEEFNPGKDFDPYTQAILWYDDEHYFSYPYAPFDVEAWDKSSIGRVNGNYEFTYFTASGGWTYNGTRVQLEDFGLNFVGTPVNGDKIAITRDQDISVSAMREERDQDATINLDIWDASPLGGQNKTYKFVYDGTHWVYDETNVTLSAFGITFTGIPEKGDTLTVKRSHIYTPDVQIAGTGEEFTVTIDKDSWEASDLGGHNGSFEFDYTGTFAVKQSIGEEEPTKISGDRLAKWNNSIFGNREGEFTFTCGNYSLSNVSSELRYRSDYKPTGLKFDYRITKDSWESGVLGGRNGTFIFDCSNTVRMTQKLNDGTATDITDVNASKWESSYFGGIDGTFKFTCFSSGSDTTWIFTSGPQSSGISVTDMSDIGVVLTATPSPGDTITVTRYATTMWTYNGYRVNMKDYGIMLIESSQNGMQIAVTRSTTTNLCWECTEGSVGVGGTYILSEIGLVYPGEEAIGSVIVVIAEHDNFSWKIEGVTVNLLAYGITAIGSFSNEDAIVVYRDNVYVDEIEGAVRSKEQKLTIDPNAWESSELGKEDGEFIFEYEITEGTANWQYIKGVQIIDVNLGAFGITYDGIPEMGDTIKITRESGTAVLSAAVQTTGRSIGGECTWATQDMAKDVYDYIKNYIYTPFEAKNVILDPAIEIGDLIVPNMDATQLYLVTRIELEMDRMFVANLSATADEEVNHEYEYISQMQKELNQKVTLGSNYYGTSITREYGIMVKREDGSSEAIFNSDYFAMRAKIDGKMQDRLYFDPVAGDYIFAGKLSADAVFTDSLYAEQGYVAELTVDRLSTSRRIREYLLDTFYRDTPAYNEDNYIEIQDYHIKWMTGTVVFISGEAVVMQASNRYGNLLYWSGLPVGCTNDGYPIDKNGSQLYSTEDNTGYPIQIYQYRELAKMQALFESDGTNYAPRIILGAGDANANNIGYLYKATDGLHIDYKNRHGLTDSIVHYETEDFWRLNGIGIAPVNELPDEPLHDVIYLTPEED